MNVAAAAAVLVVGMWARSSLVAVRGRRRRPSRHRRVRSPTAEEWAGVLDIIAAEVRAGGSLAAACSRSLARTQPHGVLLEPGWTPVPNDPAPGAALPPNGTRAMHLGAVPGPDEAVVLQAISAAQALGGPMAATLHSGASLLRERALIRAEAHSYSAQARLSSRVLTAVPLGFAGWSVLTSHSFRGALFSRVGLVSAALGACCNLLGWWWMRRIVAGAAP